MDIKNIFKVSSVGFLKPKPSSQLKLDSTTDRDGNGQSPYQKSQDQEELLTPEEFDSAIEKLKLLPPIIEHKWQIKIEKTSLDTKVFLLDNLGKMIKQVSNQELKSLLNNHELNKGNLLKREA